MRKGGTPVERFIVPSSVDLEGLAYVQIAFSQDREIVLKKKVDASEVVDNVVSVQLSQEDTFRFAAQTPVEIQLRFVFASGDVVPSQIIRTVAKKCLDRAILEVEA